MLWVMPLAPDLWTPATCDQQCGHDQAKPEAMTKKDLPSKRKQAGDPVRAFLDAVEKTPPPESGGGRARLIFAMDATASREPTWDQACHVQGQMFLETAALGGLDVQLVYYRGFDECRASRWVDNPSDLVRLMTGVFCLAGQTKIGRVLGHAVRQTEKKRVAALVFVGDCFEESLDDVGQIAGQLGMLGVRTFLFQEGHDPNAERAFRHIATLTKGAHCRFDSSSPQQLRDLLGAVAAYAAGGRRALADLSKRSGREVRLLASQVG
jgi:hypothetical protein